MKFGVYVSGDATRLIRYLEKYTKNRLPIVCVLHDGKSDNQLLCDLLLQERIHYLHVDLKTLVGCGTGGYVSDILLGFLTQNEIDYCFCFGSRILSGELLNQYRNRIINFHPSLLPAYPGLNAIDKALADGARLLGNTAHFVEEGVDAGPIIMQSVLSVASYKKYDDVLDLQLPMLHQIGLWLQDGRMEIGSRKVSVRGSAKAALAQFSPVLDFLERPESMQ